MDYNFSVVHGEGLQSIMKEIASLSVTVFREYPYLFDGNVEEEKADLANFLSSQGSLAVVAKEGKKVIGAVTGKPLIETSDQIIKVFEEKGHSVHTMFYLMDLMLLKEYRGRGLGQKLYRSFEIHVKNHLQFPTLAFCEVVRPREDTRRPAGLVGLDGFWKKSGFVKQPEMVTHFSWKEVDQPESRPNPMVFWLQQS